MLRSSCAAPQYAGLSQHRQPQYQDEQHTPSAAAADPSRYDDALYGQIESGGRTISAIRPIRMIPTPTRTLMSEEPRRRRASAAGLFTVVAVLALAVLGTGGAFAYRTFVGSPRSGEPPIIKADNSPTKVVPAPVESAAKAPDRMAIGDGTEKMVPARRRRSTSMRRSGPRVVFPPLNQNANPPSAASVAPAGPRRASAGNGTLPKATSRAGSGRSRSRVIRPMLACRSMPPRRPRPAAARRARRTTAAPAPAAPAARSPPSRPMPAPMRRSRCRRRRRHARRRRAAGPGCRRQSGAAPRRQWRWIFGPGLLAEERGGRAGLVPGAAGQVPGGAGFPRAADQACGSRRKGRLLPRHGRAVRLPG